MKKTIKTITMLLLFILFTSSSFTQQRKTPPVLFNKISERLYETVGGSGARGGVYIGDNGVLVIDAKMDKNSVEQVLEGIRKITGKPIKYMVNTHSDGDHISGNKYLPETITVIAQENCRKDLFRPLRDGHPSEWSNPDMTPFIPSLTFRDKMDVYLGSKKVKLRYFGIGHTTGDIVIYFPEEKTAFIGDQYFYGRPQLIHSHKGGNSFGHVENLSKMLETLDAEKFYSGHSEPVDRKEIQNHINQMKNRQKKVESLLKKEKNLDEIKLEFEENEAGLIETIYKEIRMKDKG